MRCDWDEECFWWTLNFSPPSLEPKKEEVESDAEADEMAGFVEGEEGYNLINAIIENSVAKTWEEAKKEWILDYIDIATDEEVAKSTFVCVCGHRHLKDLCYIRNIKNLKTLLIGNICIKKFLKNLESDKIFSALKRRKPNQAVINYARIKDLLNDNEYDFMCNVLRKRKLSERQIAWKTTITERLFKDVEMMMVQQ